MEIIKRFRIGKMINNTFLINVNDKIILIDAPDGIEKVISFLNEKNLILEEVWLTHCHFDHIVGLNALKKSFPSIKVYSSKEEMNMINDSNGNYSKEFLNMELEYHGEVFDNSTLLDEYDELKIEFISGHSLNSSVYVFEKDDVMFSGDVLFRETIGRSDLKYGDFNKLNSSIKKQLFKYEDKTKVYPGHGFSTDIGHEKKNNKVII